MKPLKKRQCEHKWQPEVMDDQTFLVGETKTHAIECEKCGLEAREVWVFSNIINRETGEVIN